MLASSRVVIAIYSIMFRRLDNAMYTVISVYIYTRYNMTLMLYGSSQSKLCHIISDEATKSKAEIRKSHCTRARSHPWSTGKGRIFPNQDQQILLCVC